VARKFRCTLGFHKWVTHVNPDGESYFKCRDCGKYHDRAASVMRFGGRR
jgi:hypothetical protein